jgi:hypothetical protein
MQGHHVQVSVFLQAVALDLNFIGQNFILVGGFGNSQYLRRELRKCLHQGVELTLANESTWVLIELPGVSTEWLAVPRRSRTGLQHGIFDER